MDEKGQSGPGQAYRKATVTLYERGEPKSISEWKTLWGMGNQTNQTRSSPMNQDQESEGTRSGQGYRCVDGVSHRLIIMAND